MATNFKFIYSGGFGQLLGSYMSIGYGSVNRYIDLVLSHENNTLGRFVTLAYWICDKYFDITNLNMNPKDSNGPRYCTSIDTTYASVIKNRYAGDNFDTCYVNTNAIPNNKEDTCRFYFNHDIDGIKANKIFIALISTKTGAAIYDYNNSTLSVCIDKGSTYIKHNIDSDAFQIDNNGGLYIYDSLFENVDNSSCNHNESSSIKPPKIECSDLRYRTWSEPDGPFKLNNVNKTTSKEYKFNRDYRISFIDGGENYLDVSDSDYKTLSYTYNDVTGDIVTHVNNESKKENGHYLNSKFNSDFGIPEGRLKDVVFDRPDKGAYDFESSTTQNIASEGRWVFKRSRIKFTIPPIKKNGSIINKGIVLRYKVIASMYDNTAYSNTYKIKEYTVNDAIKNISLVICPRDEGILDNTEFTVLLSRKYVGASDKDYSDEVAYKFHTYQKPVVNIAYPKIIRNTATGTKFKYAKILTSNMYSNFSGENTIVNKYVCDALTVLLASSQKDASDIPTFARFYLLEYKYGRDGRVIDGNLNNDFDTVQLLYKSNDSKKYTSLKEILTGTFDDANEYYNDNNKTGTYKLTASKAGIYANDGQPILISGRFTDSTLSEIGSTYKLWTYKDWDEVSTNTTTNTKFDELVGNAWEVIAPKRDSSGYVQYNSDGSMLTMNIASPIVGDHMGMPIPINGSDNHIRDYTQTVSKNILFRAGYIYLLRVRMFHGAAAGAIARNYSYSDKKYKIIYGDVESGFYNYDGASYSNGKEYPSTDIVQHGTLQPYDNWYGPDDGTTGEQLFNSKSNDMEYNNKLSQTYSGFSEVDYTLIEPVCPFTSKSNLITVHPSSPQISANQWITFNYRHLAKNVGGSDFNSSYFDGTKYVNSSIVFGKTANGIQNTLTRAVSMYTSAIETILTNYATNVTRTASNFNELMGNPHNCDVSEPTLVSEKISIWTKPIKTKQLAPTDNGCQDYVSAYGKDNGNNYPIVFEYAANGKAISDIFNDKFYYGDSLCSEFNKYRLRTENYNATSNTYDLSKFNYMKAPEFDIIYKDYNNSKTGNASRYLSLSEPLGNTYRWQPVINAVTKTGSSVNEIQIENNNDNKTIAKGYTIGNNTLRQTRTFNSDKVHLLYAADENNTDYDLQTSYFYKDVHSIQENIFTNDDTRRFCIKEFAGSVNNAIHNSGYPVMYTTACNSDSRYGNYSSYKYFCTALQDNKYHGHLYSRVPTIQDCECGIPTPNGLPNIGNVSSKGSISVNFDENNVIPITRTTHYLYFKSWINTTFVMKVDITLSCNHSCEKETNDEGTSVHKGHETSKVTKTFWFNGNTLVKDIYAAQNSQNKDLLDTYPLVEIKLGNNEGLSEVYGEDNNGWGRCLSADDISNRQLKYDGSISSEKTKSGGLEVPIMVRYTPLLQPKLLAKTCSDTNSSNSEKYLSSSSLNITLIKYRGKNQWKSSFVDGTLSDNGTYTQIETDAINLKVAYPYVNEMGTYYTTSPNGGNGGNVYFDGYYYDTDTNVAVNIDNSKNMDFLGGSGICTAYTVLLVPSNPDLSEISDFERQWYFNNTNNHWNYYKQRANYYKLGDIFNEVRSKTVENCGPVLVGYNLQPQYEDSCNYVSNSPDVSIPSNFVRTNMIDGSFKGRNYQNIRLNFTNLRQGKFMFENENNICKLSDAKTKLGFNLTEDNILQPGMIYDLVIVPIYSSTTIKSLNYNRDGGYSPGVINGQIPGGGIKEDNVHLAGSNPLVLYNYFQVGLETEISDNKGGGSHVDEPDPSYIYDSDSAIVFPNVDNVMFNSNSGEIKEPPGFWLNNSFKLILRMPSFRLKSKQYNEYDLNTIDNMSNGQLLTKNGDTADMFEFSDIQIHIGKISELMEYGYPDKQHLNLNKLTSKEDLAKAHIISYAHYGSLEDGVFSKKLSNYNDSDNDDDTREKVTGGSLDPTKAEYAHRFIEVNLSNCKIANSNGDLVPIYTLYPEGYYIQFRWKSKYAESQPEEHRWSDWYGGAYDGGLKWWGNNGTDYFVPTRNYSDIYTDFRNHIKESYPGSYLTMPKEPVEISENSKRILENIIGKGSHMDYGSMNNSSLNNPKDGTSPGYYHIGVGNHVDSMVVPSIRSQTVEETLSDKGIRLSDNYDNLSIYDIQYYKTHDKSTNEYQSPTGDAFRFHQHLWEMLYVDYIIRNMCKLYYKPKYNIKADKFNSNLYYHLALPSTVQCLSYLTWGHDNTEFRMFNNSLNIKNHKGSTNELEFSENKAYANNKLYEYDVDTDSVNQNGLREVGPSNYDGFTMYSEDDRKHWNRNKYYRRIITRQDFDELNNHLENLVEFIRRPEFTGLNDNNKYILNDILPISKKELLSTFNKARGGLIGHDLTGQSGLNRRLNINNVNYGMMSSNYIQCLWQNVLSICNPSIQQTTDRSNDLTL